MRYDVHFCNPMLADAQGFWGATDLLTRLSVFDYCYRYVGTFEADDLDALFELLQDGGGGLGDEPMQRYVMRHVLHTSMTGGDVAIERDTGRVFQCMLGEWRQAKLS